MRRLPQPVSVEMFPEPIRHFVELDRKVMNHLFDKRLEPINEVATSEEFLSLCSEAFAEECISWVRDITFGDFVLESIDTFSFRKK